jgi:hypothetical protein
VRQRNAGFSPVAVDHRVRMSISSLRSVPLPERVPGAVRIGEQRPPAKVLALGGSGNSTPRSISSR